MTYKAARTEYNGWTNHITWAAHLWITNDEPTYNSAHAATESLAALEGYARAHPNLSRQLADECDKGETVGDSNWAEIQEALLKE